MQKKAAKKGGTEEYCRVVQKDAGEEGKRQVSKNKEGWVQKRLCDSGWSDEMKFWGCGEDEGTEKHRLHHCDIRRDVRNQIPERLGKWEQRSNDVKGGLDLAQRLFVVSSHSGINWRKSRLSCQSDDGKAQKLEHASRWV